ncbi:MAG: serine/threonine protein kinase, partial [Planctomycetaceae bacterium]|nr:serine/threonine protein kinase [Planctomycetaceae bacterium]
MSDTEFPQNSKIKSRVKAPRQIGKYQLQKRLGAGGMGAVFLATDEKTKRSVALKVLPRDKAANDVLVKRFQSEAHAAANLEHENIVRVYEADEADGYLYIALEYIEGTDVDQILKKRERMPVKRAAEIIKQVALALDHAFAQNIIHRDIKPSNIMIRKDGVVKLTDLGLARSIDETDDTNITRAGTTVGTVDYMAPEQARNSRLADIRSDLYSLGCTWYQMIVGHPPYHEGSMTNKLQAHASGAIPDPRDENPDVPEATVIMIQQLMAKKPEDRYQTPADLLKDFENSALHRETISDDVLSALAASELTGEIPADQTSDASSQEAEEDDSPTRRKKKKGRRSPSSSPNSSTNDSGGQRALPPRTRPSTGQKPKTSPDEDQEKVSFLNSDAVKYLAIAGAFVGVFIGIWYVLSSLASGLDPGGTLQVGESQRQTARDLIGQESAPPPSLKKGSDSQTDTQPTQVTLSGPDQSSDNSDAPVSTVLLTPPTARVKPPHWSRQVPMADEIGKLLTDWKLKPRTVGRWQNSIGAFGNLETACADLPSGNVWLQLVGPGPFLMSPQSFRGRNVVISAASNDVEPIVVCAASKPQAEFLAVQQGTLLLAGVNLVIDAQQFPTTGPASLLAVTQGNLHLRDVSLTLYGHRDAPTFAISQSQSANSQEQNQTLIDRSLIRGHWTSLHQSQSHFSAVIANSLLVTDQSPVLKIDSQALNQKQGNHFRTLEIVKSSLITSSDVMLAASSDDPVRLHVTLDSTQMVHFADSDRALVRLENWPVSASPAAGQSSANHFLWETTSSSLVGWKTLVASSSDSSTPVSSVDSWERFWGDPLELAANASETWNAPQPVDNASFDIAAWANGDSSVGCPATMLSLPKATQQRTAAAISGLRHPQPVSLPVKPVATVELNLDKTNLDDVLAKTDWKSGTRFLLSGTKSEEISAVEVEGRSFILEMAPDQPESFEILSRSNQKSSLFTVRNASVQLKNVKIRIPNRAPRVSQPTWLVDVSNGSLLIENSSLTGPDIVNQNHQGLIRWETGTGRSLPESVKQPHVLRMENSFLRTRGSTVSLSADSGLVQVSNSVVAAEGVAWDCELLGGTQASPTIFDLKYSTFAATQAIWNLHGTPDDNSGTYGEFLVRECLAANIGSENQGRSKMAFLVAQPAWLDGVKLLWWGRGNGYSTSISCFMKPPGADGESQPLDRWLALWGPLNVQKPLYSPDGVIFAGADIAAAEIPAEYFSLDARARAASCSSAGDALGARPKTYAF